MREREREKKREKGDERERERERRGMEMEYKRRTSRNSAISNDPGQELGWNDDDYNHDSLRVMVNYFG